MSFDPDIAQTRFGLGLSPNQPAPGSVVDMLDQLRGPDVAAQAYHIPKFQDVTPHVTDFLTAHRARVAARGTPDEAVLLEEFQTLRRAGRGAREVHFRATLARWAHTPDGFRERLVAFWGDHFTIRSKNGQTAHMVQPFLEEVIRPNLIGDFATMLRAVTLHPMMLRYLDQVRSMGPNSPAAQSRDAGLNENLAREVLELHTLGVDGPYTQTDVRELAELLTGLSYHPRNGFVFRERFAEPGAETVLGQTYGGPDADLSAIHQVLDDLAQHPATARHLAHKLAVHFVSDQPPPDLVHQLEAAYMRTDGDLFALYEVLLAHPAAWQAHQNKVKPPFDFVCSALRALSVPDATLLSLTRRDILRGFYRPMQLMGQTWQSPLGPDGWPEEARAWVTPQGMAARINWAMEVPVHLLSALPDPRRFVATSLGSHPPAEVTFAASAAETVPEGVGIVLASPAFQRR